jgi:hypothetical protein
MLLTLLRAVAGPHLRHLTLLPSDLSIVLCILLLDLHEDASQLDALIEVLKDLLLNATDLLTFLYLAARTYLPLLPDEGVPRMDGLLLR